MIELNKVQRELILERDSVILARYNCSVIADLDRLNKKLAGLNDRLGLGLGKTERPANRRAA